MTSSLDAFNQAYGISWAPVNQEEARQGNLVKLQFLVPFWSLILYYGGKGSGLDLKKPLLAKAIISSTIIGVPVNLAVDAVASVTTQIANVVFKK